MEIVNISAFNLSRLQRPVHESIQNLSVRLLDKGLNTDAFLMHIKSMKTISEESMLIYKEVKTIKDKYKQKMDEKHAKIDTLN